MSEFRRKLMMIAASVIAYVSAWFRSEGWYRDEPW